MMQVVVVDSTVPGGGGGGALTQEHADRIVAGIERVGDSATRSSSLGWSAPWVADAIVSWGVRCSQAMMVRAPRHVVVELGFLGDRTQNLSVGVFGLNGHGCLPGTVIPGRGLPWQKDMMPRRERAHERVVLLGQVPNDTSLWPLTLRRGTFMQDSDPLAYTSWLAMMAQHCVHNGMEVGWRGHPKAREHPQLKPDQVTMDFDQLDWTKEEVWAWADLAVAFSSNSLVEAFLSGVDVLPGHQTSLCWDVRSWFHLSRRLTEADSLRWLDTVATRQWSLREIESGAMWEYVRAGL